MQRVCIKFDTLEKNSNDFLKYSEELREIINNIKDITNFESSWISQNQTLYSNMIKNYLTNLQKNENKMAEYGKVILQMNDIFKENENDYSKQLYNDTEEIDDYARN